MQCNDLQFSRLRSLLQVFAGQTCFLLDVMVRDPDAKAAVIRLLRSLTESSTIIKVVHGCADLATVLKYKLGIGLRSVFDLEVTAQTCTHI